MTVTIEQVKRGIRQYVDQDILPHTSGLVRVGMATYITLILQSDKIEGMLDSKFVKPLGIIDSDGRVDIDKVRKAVMDNIESGQKIDVDVPIVGHILFTANDIDKLCGFIKKEG